MRLLCNGGTKQKAEHILKTQNSDVSQMKQQCPFTVTDSKSADSPEIVLQGDGGETCNDLKKHNNHLR